MSKNKVLLVGWDAADWKIIDKLMDNGLMPALKSIVDNGVRGKLATLDPPLSPMLWTTMATGVRPYKHGVIGFVEQDGVGGVRPVSSHYRKVRAVWNMFSMEGLRSNVVAWWPSNPVETINGCMVSNLFHQERKGGETIELQDWEIPAGTIYPEYMTDRLKELRVHPSEITGNLVMPFVPQAVNLDKKQDKRLTVISKFIAHATTVHAACTELMEADPWDFTAVYHDALDHFSHGFMKYHPPKMEGLDDETFLLFKDVVIGAYVYHDMMLDRLLKLIDEDTTIVVVSDHGFHSDHLRPTHVPNVPSGPAIEHAPYGIFAAKGPGIKKGERIYGASVLDVTPTLLSLFDLPVGKDMDGKPLLDIFSYPKQVKYIDSWENREEDGGQLVDDGSASKDTNEAALQQLVDLGYIDDVKLNGSSEEKNRYLMGVLVENRFYLAKSLVAGGEYEEALEILLEIEDKAKPDFRFIMEIIQCAIRTKRFDLAQEYIDFAEKIEVYSEAFVCSLKAKICLGKSEPDEALGYLKQASRLNPEAIDLLLDLGKLYNLTRMTAEARDCYSKVISKDPDNPYAFHGVGLSLLREEKCEEAVDYFLQAIERLYHYPLAHLHLAESLALMKEYELAIPAFEVAATMLPDMPKVFRWLVDLNELTGDKDRSAFYQKQLDKMVKGHRVILTGMPSEIMSDVKEFISSLGMPIDDRLVIENGDKLEFSQLDSHWEDQLDGDLALVPLHMLTGLSARYNYRIIYVYTDPVRFMENVSAKNARGETVFDPVIYKALLNQQRHTITWLNQQPDLDIFNINELSSSNKELLLKYLQK